MPIYAYKCESCGHRQDVLQKLSDPVLSVCPACGESAFAKQLTAAGFQLKGSGWYATDFRNNGNAPAPKPGAESASTPAADTPAPSSQSPAAAAPPAPKAAEGGSAASAT